MTFCAGRERVWTPAARQFGVGLVRSGAFCRWVRSAQNFQRLRRAVFLKGEKIQYKFSAPAAGDLVEKARVQSIKNNTVLAAACLKGKMQKRVKGFRRLRLVIVQR